MGSNPYPGQGPGAQPGFGERLEDLWARIESELRIAAGYVNDNVVPQVKKESVTAMRSVAEALRNLADKIEKAEQKGPQE